jgi:hypothetical protein
MALRPGVASHVRVEGSSGRPVSARRGKTVEERRAEIVAANARLRGQLSREKSGWSTDVTVRPSADPDLRTLETQRDTLRAQLMQLTGVLASRRNELTQLRRGHLEGTCSTAAASRSQPPLASQLANGPHGHSQEYVMSSEPAASDLNTSGLVPSDLDDSDYTELDFANDAAVVAAEGWGDESALPEERSGDWREDMMSVISRDKRAAERGSSRSLLSVDLSSAESASGSDPNGIDAGSQSGSEGGSMRRQAVVAPAPAPALPAAVSTDSRTELTISATVAAYDWSDQDQAYLHSSSTRTVVDLLEPQQAAGALQLSPAEMFYSSVKRAVGWDDSKHGAFVISDCIASEGPGAPHVFGGSNGPEDGSGSAQPLLDAFTVRGLGLWHGCTVQVRRPDPRAPLC